MNVQTHTVRDIMSSNVITINKQDTFSTLRKLLETHDFHHIPVVENDELIGMLSTTDVLKYSFGTKSTGEKIDLDQYLDAHLSIETMMKTSVISVSPDAPVKDAAKKLFECDFNALPVTNEKGQLLGILTTKDLVKYIFTK